MMSDNLSANELRITNDHIIKLQEQIKIALLLVGRGYCEYGSINLCSGDNICAIKKMIRSYLNDLTKLFDLINNQNKLPPQTDRYEITALSEFVNWEKGFSVFDELGNDDLDTLEIPHPLLEDFFKMTTDELFKLLNHLKISDEKNS